MLPKPYTKKIEVETESTIVAIRVLGAFNLCTNRKAREGVVVVDSETCSAELIKCVWKWEKQSKLNFKVLNFQERGSCPNIYKLYFVKWNRNIFSLSVIPSVCIL